VLEAMSGGPAVPGGLAIKLHPCCYALQRPIAAVRELRARHPELRAADVEGIRVTTPASSLQPLIHDRPTTGLEGKFSLPYALAAALLDDHPDFASFSDAGVRRPEARRLLEAVEVTALPGGEGLLDGEISIALKTQDGGTFHAVLALPPGAPGRPPTDDQLEAKVRACAPDPAVASQLAALTWETAPAFLRQAR
jgi:2-methylcitrate dehydratase PrpD